LIYALQSIYPEHRWQVWRFNEHPKGPRGFFNDDENLRMIFDTLAQELGLKELDEWCHVQLADIKPRRIRLLIRQRFQNSLLVALQSIYPEHLWQVWKFGKVPLGYWCETSNGKRFLEWVANRLDIVQMDDWYRVSTHQLCFLGGEGFRKRIGGLHAMLTQFFPERRWDLYRLSSVGSISKEQQHLLRVVRTLFPNENVLSNGKHPNMVFFDSGKAIELDIYIPALCLAFEYQGKPHYAWHTMYGNPSELRKRDLQKKEICLRNEITLVEIPFSWDGDQEALALEICSRRPDLFSNRDLDLRSFQYKQRDRLSERSELEVGFLEKARQLDLRGKNDCKIASSSRKTIFH